MILSILFSLNMNLISTNIYKLNININYLSKRLDKFQKAWEKERCRGSKKGMDLRLDNGNTRTSYSVGFFLH